MTRSDNPNLDLRRGEAGSSSVEYAVLLGLIAVGVLASVLLIGSAARKNLELQGGSSSAGTGGSSGGTSSEQTTGQVFQDGFDSWGTTKKNWEFMGKDWLVKDGVLLAGTPKPTREELRALAEQTEGTDYTISLDARLLAGNGYGVYFRCSEDPGELNGYSFQYDPGYGGGQFIMRKWVHGYEIWPPFVAEPAPAGYDWYGESRHIELTVQGTTFTAKVDGQVVLQGSDRTYSRGRTGLRVWTGGQASFDNYTVQTSKESSHD